MQPISLTPQAPAPATGAPSKKLLRVAEQFETVLLNDLLGSLEKTFASVPGEKDSPGSSEYSYLGTQALASGVAAGGGFGIAAMIVRNVMKQQGLRAHPESGMAAKVSRPVGR